MKRLVLLVALVAMMAPDISSAQTQEGYVWESEVIMRVGTNGNRRDDTNRRDLTIPLRFPDNDPGPDVEFIGFGQIMAPNYFYQIYNSILTDDSFLHLNEGGEFTDQDYIDQFKNSGAWTLDSLRLLVYKNPRSTPSWPAQFIFYKVTDDFSSTQYRQNGFSRTRASLDSIPEATILFGPEDLDGTVSTEETIVPTTFYFDPPLTFEKGESLVMCYVNDLAPPIDGSTIGGDNDQQEWQSVIAAEEYRTGDIFEDPNNPGQFINTLANPLQPYQTMAVVVYRNMPNTEGDAVISASRALQFSSGTQARPALMNLYSFYWGAIELGVSGVKYHFGTDVSEQGLGQVTPNPVTAGSNARLPFNLTTSGQVTIDLFDANGAHVQTLVQDKYVPGAYSVPLPVDNLTSGAYMVRMTIGDQGYSMKFNVTR